MLGGHGSVKAACRVNHNVSRSGQDCEAVKIQGRKCFQKTLELNAGLRIVSGI